MLNTLASISLTFALMCTPYKAIAGIIYNIAPREGITTDWSFDGGWIETDGTIGEITFGNFLDWELQFSSPAGTSIINGQSGNALSVVIEYTTVVAESITAPPPLVATQEHIVANPASGRNILLFFSDQDLFSDPFTGQAIVLLPLPDSAVRLAKPHQNCCGLLVDNTIDKAHPYSPLGSDSEQSLQNRGIFNVPRGPLVIASAIDVPEPSTTAIIAVVILLFSFPVPRVETRASHAVM